MPFSPPRRKFIRTRSPNFCRRFGYETGALFDKAHADCPRSCQLLVTGESPMPKNSVRYVGLDVHKRVVEACFIDTHGTPAFPMPIMQPAIWAWSLQRIDRQTNAITGRSPNKAMRMHVGYSSRQPSILTNTLARWGISSAGSCVRRNATWLWWPPRENSPRSPGNCSPRMSLIVTPPRSRPQ